MYNKHRIVSIVLKKKKKTKAWKRLLLRKDKPLNKPKTQFLITIRHWEYFCSFKITHKVFTPREFIQNDSHFKVMYDKAHTKVGYKGKARVAAMYRILITGSQTQWVFVSRGMSK